MLTIRIDWNNGFEITHSVYACSHYTVSEVEDKNACSSSGATYKQTHLYLDDGKHHILMSQPTTAYVMNGNGATIDTIRAV